MSDFKLLSENKLMARMAVEFIEQRLGETATPKAVALLTDHLVSFEKELHRMKPQALAQSRQSNFQRIRRRLTNKLFYSRIMSNI